MSSFLNILRDILIFSAVVLLTATTMREIERLMEQKRRLGGLGVDGRLPTTPLMAKRDTENKFMTWVQASTSISDDSERQKLRQSLFLAGFSSPNAVIWYVICRFALALILPGLYLLMQFTSTRPATGFSS